MKSGNNNSIADFVLFKETGDDEFDFLVRKTVDSLYVKAGYFRSAEFRGQSLIEYTHTNKNLKAMYTSPFMNDLLDGLCESVKLNTPVILRSNDTLIIQRPGLKSNEKNDLFLNFDLD